MDTFNARLMELVEAAEHAYEQARIHVFDRWPAGVPIDASQLTPRQRDTYSRLLLAEAALEEYRADQYSAQHLHLAPIGLPEMSSATRVSGGEPYLRVPTA